MLRTVLVDNTRELFGGVIADSSSPLMCQSLWGADRSHGSAAPWTHADKTCAQISIRQGGNVGSAFVTPWPSCTVSLLDQPPEARPPSSQGGLTRRPRTDLRPLTELHLPSGILLGPVGFVTHSQFCQPVSQTKATVTGHCGSQLCLTRLCVTKYTHIHTKE